MESWKLFREEAQYPRATNVYGTIVLAQPVALTILAWLAALFGLTIIVFFAYGSYTRRSTLSGQLMPVAGIIKLYSPQVGVIAEKRIIEGQPVKRGDVMYVMTNLRLSPSLGDIQESVSQQVAIRRQSLRNAIDQTKQLLTTDQNSARKKLQGLQNEGGAVDNLLNVLRQRVTLAEQVQARYGELLKQGYISKNDSMGIQADLLDQRARLQTLERDRVSLQRQIQDVESGLKELPLRYQNQIAELERDVSSTEQELAQNEITRKWAITAPENGIATSVVGEVGQSIDSSRPLMSIFPQESQLQAYLYAPSRAIGFVKPGDTVYLRYQAYPYQKFGHYPGLVSSVSLVAASADELAANNVASNSKEMVYRITVNLESQNVFIYGKTQALQAGMLLEADVFQETRRLYEWVLEPLITLTGKFK